MTVEPAEWLHLVGIATIRHATEHDMEETTLCPR